MLLGLGRFTEGLRPGVKRNNDEERSSESLGQNLVNCWKPLKPNLPQRNG